MEINHVLFNRPNKPIHLDMLWSDMLDTTNHLVLASAWFTDTETANVFIKSPAKKKTVILNAADVNRGDKKAVALLRAYHKESIEKIHDLFHRKILHQTEHLDMDFYIIGSGNWQEGVMHHKFILCDRSVWVGSFNFTFQARKNYETLLRIEDAIIVKLFYEEVNALDPLTYNEEHPEQGTFQCRECTKVLPWNLLGEDLGYGEYICGVCNYPRL